MRFAKEGYFPSSIPAVAGVVGWAAFGWQIGAPLLVSALLVLLFFRDPERTPDGGPGAIIAPADGKVVYAGPVDKPHRMAPDATQRVSIFMSPLDVHINRIPADCTVEEVRYSPGRFDAAYKEKAAEVNESNALLVTTETGTRMVVIQIAGWLARRIICKVNRGDRLGRGERFGLIMFGSRVDVYLPSTVSLTARVGQRAASGRTVIAEETQSADPASA